MAVLGLMGLLMLGVSCAIAQPPDEAPVIEQPVTAQPELARTPTDTIYAFVFRLNAMNLRECAALVDGAKFSARVAQIEQQFKQQGDQLLWMVDEPRVEMIDENRARASVQTTLLTLQNGTVRKDVTLDWLQLRRVGGAWKLVSTAVKADENVTGSSLQEVVRFLVATEQTWNDARAKTCQMNMKQLCLGMFQLAQDSDGKFGVKNLQALQQPNNQFANLPIFAQAVMPYVKSMQIFRCPADSDKGKDLTSYSFNENLEGVSQNQLMNPAEIVLIYEGKDGKLEFRHGGKTTIGFADGHVKLVSEAEAKKLLWKP